MKDKVIVETAMGDEIGEVVVNKRELPDEKVTSPLKVMVSLV